MCRHELQHFVDVMQGYLSNQLLHLSWQELEYDLTHKVRRSGVRLSLLLGYLR